MLSEYIFIGGVAYEALKYRLSPSVLFPSIEDWIETNVPDDRSTEPCSGDLLCQREGARHKTGCIGRTMPFDTYVKGLGDVQC